METFLVGGAVRDKLLNIPIKDEDWVVVGARPKDLLALGYKQVGKGFPVFLHPDSKQEYALARTERKQGTGHTGFDIDASEHVSLEEDLLRRDLTINAMAQTETGEIIDPFKRIITQTSRLRFDLIILPSTGYHNFILLACDS